MGCQEGGGVGKRRGGKGCWGTSGKVEGLRGGAVPYLNHDGVGSGDDVGFRDGEMWFRREKCYHMYVCMRGYV